MMFHGKFWHKTALLEPHIFNTHLSQWWQETLIGYVDISSDVSDTACVFSSENNRPIVLIRNSAHVDEIPKEMEVNLITEENNCVVREA